MSYIPGIIGAIGGIAGLFGGGSKAPSNPYAGYVTGNLNNASNNARNIQGLGQNAENTYSEFSPGANTAISDYAQYLQQNPFTSAYSSALLNKSLAGTTTAYQQARSQLEGTLGQRGMLGSGLEAGTLGELAGQQAQTTANTGLNLGLAQSQQLGQNKADLVDLLSGTANNAYGQAVNADTSAADIQRAVASEYGGLGQTQQEFQMQQNNQQNEALGALGEGVGGIFAATSGNPYAKLLSNMQPAATPGAALPVTPGAPPPGSTPYISPGMQQIYGNPYAL